MGLLMAAMPILKKFSGSKFLTINNIKLISFFIQNSYSWNATKPSREASTSNGLKFLTILNLYALQTSSMVFHQYELN